MQQMQNQFGDMGGMGAQPAMQPQAQAQPQPDMQGQAPAQPQGPAPDPKLIEAFKQHSKVLVKDLIGVVQMPPGKLTKKAVFDAAADAIAKGCFPTQEAKQDLIVRLASLPDDEPSLRKALGGMLMQAIETHDALHAHFPDAQ